MIQKQLHIALSFYDNVVCVFPVLFDEGQQDPKFILCNRLPNTSYYKYHSAILFKLLKCFFNKINKNDNEK